ncbi:MAG: hypothetical protein KDD22_02610, partial [Bdellovibrionales bacterium]|nr:hypothetical protein [Bdellovibrionales bacterium]
IEVRILGEATVETAVPSKEVKKGREFYRALVKKSIANVLTGSQVQLGSLERVSASIDGPRSQTVAQITGGLHLFNEKSHSLQDIVFLNRGADDGLNVGEILPIRPIEQMRNPTSMIDESVRSIGYLRVVKTTSKFATAMVVKSWEDILTGDLTGQGPLLAKTVSQSAPIPDAAVDGEDFSEGSSVELFPAEDSDSSEFDDGFSEDTGEEDFNL